MRNSRTTGLGQHRIQLGKKGEALASAEAESYGWTVLHRNWRCTMGELDLICQDGETLVIIEVRTRSGSGLYGTPEESIHARKQWKLRQVAAQYMRERGLHEQAVRFDVMAITLRNGEAHVLRHIKGAF